MVFTEHLNSSNVKKGRLRHNSPQLRYNPLEDSGSIWPDIFDVSTVVVKQFRITCPFKKDYFLKDLAKPWDACSMEIAAMRLGSICRNKIKLR